MDNVTVIIPHYNKKIELQRAVDSVLAQDYPLFDIIIVDDGSDETLDLYENDSRIHILRHDRNKGVAVARNTGVENAKGPYITFLDSDDEFCAGKLRAQMTYMIERNINTSVTNAYFAMLNSDTLHKRELPEHIKEASIAKGLGINFGSCFMFHKDIWNKAGGMDNHLRRLEDWDWLLRFYSKGGKIQCAPIYGSIIHVGSPPSIDHVAEATGFVSMRFNNHFYRRQIHAACELELASVFFWHKKFMKFVRHFIRAANFHPIMAISFIFKRVVRILKGDAPRFFNLFR